MSDMQRVTELGFADFVAMLLVETLDAIVASHTSQEERIRALHTAAGQDLATFAENVTDDILDAALTQLFPDGDGATTIAAGAPAPSRDDLASLGITLTSAATDGRALTASGVRQVRAGVREHLARTHQESLSEVARRGVPRVLVDRGVLRSKLTFSALRRQDTEPAAATTPTGPSPTGPAPTGPAPTGPVASSGTILSAATVSAFAMPTAYLPLLQRGVMDSIARTRLTVAPAAPAAGTEPSPTTQSTATIYGEVELHFHTER